MNKCPKCESEKTIKDGNANGSQRRKCNSCGYRYTREKLRGKDKSIKRLALELYLEGLGFRAIGRILKVGHVSVYRWIKAFGEGLEEVSSKEEVKIVELDELHTYVKSKKTIAGYGLLLIELGRDTSVSLLAVGELGQAGDYGIKSNIIKKPIS